MRTEDLIRVLSADARPVRRMASPVQRALLWLLPSLAYALLVALVVGLRPDIEAKLTQSRFTIEVVAALLTGLCAAVAAFGTGSPGRPPRLRLLPLAPLLVWLASLGEGCWRSWLALGGAGLAVSPDLICFPSIVLVGVIPGALMFAMIRRDAPLAPVVSMALAALAAAALGAAVLRLFHIQDASVMVLLWQFGSVALITGLGALGGRRTLRWPELPAT